MAPFTAIFCGALVVNAVATFRSSSMWTKYRHLFGYATISSNEQPLLEDDKTSSEVKAKHSSLMKKYMAVYLLAVFSDWLQGPYVYALYDAYGYSQHDIAVLFVAGFGSSMVFGTFIGGMADACGRKKFTIFFAVIYALSCVTKHFNDFKVLLLGRLLGGIATSLLFSVFDAWLIRSHAEAGASSMLSKAFATAQYGNSIIAIIAGLMANKAASLTKLEPLGKDGDVLYQGGFLNPFDLALVALVMCGIVAFFLWDENFGENKSDSDSDEDEGHQKRKHWYDAFVNAYFTTINSKAILFTGLVSSLFEGSMYIFVFMWTPAMKEKTDGDIPFGVIFATFMVCCMAGSSLFSIFIGTIKNEKLGVYVLAVATGTFLLMALAPNDTLSMVAFLMFETTVGCYFPMMGTMKSIIVPENKRAAIYNLFRIPLNFIVLFSLLTDLTPKQSFYLCVAMLSTATFLQSKLVEHQQTFYSTLNNDDDLELGEEKVMLISGSAPSSPPRASQDSDAETSHLLSVASVSKAD
jgi:MFS family permease